jgi:hypothetical protein
MDEKLVLVIANRLVKENKDMIITELDSNTVNLKTMNGKVQILFEDKAPKNGVVTIRTDMFDNFITDIYFSFKEYSNSTATISADKVIKWVNSVLEHITKIAIADNL